MKIVAPLYVMQSKTKKFYFGLNIYRNAHYQLNNKTKIAYKEAIKSQIQDLPVFEKIVLRYTLFPKTKKLCDISNILSIHDKYFCDALIELGKLPDDNYLYLPKVIYRIGNIDSINPRVEIEIKEINK